MKRNQFSDALEAAGALAVAAQAVLDGKDDALGRLRKALVKYDQKIFAMGGSVMSKQDGSRGDNLGVYVVKAADEYAATSGAGLWFTWDRNFAKTFTRTEAAIVAAALNLFIGRTCRVVRAKWAE